MSRIKHPIRAIREPFGTAGLVVAIVALVLALTGAAFAAAGLTGKQKKEVEKIAKKFAGKPGAPGAPGAAGPAGKEGQAGTNGKNGTNGESVKISAATSGPSGECPEGGSKFTVGTEKGKACNGSPWTAGGTLPSGQTETGAWVTPHPVFGENETQAIPLSFPIPLPTALEEGEAESGGCAEPEETRTQTCQVHFILEGGEEELVGAGGEHHATQSVCPGSVSEPKAEPGNLCVYSGPILLHVGYLNLKKPGLQEHGAGTAGATLTLSSFAENPRVAFGGTWAVTAE